MRVLDVVQAERERRAGGARGTVILVLKLLAGLVVLEIVRNTLLAQARGRCAALGAGRARRSDCLA